MRVHRVQGLENNSIMTALKRASPDMTAVFHPWLYGRFIRVCHRCCEHGRGSSKFDVGELKSIHGGSMGWGLKILLKIPVKEFI